jgi:protein SCO1/2
MPLVSPLRVLVLIVCLPLPYAAARQSFPAAGLVLSVNPAQQTIVVSCGDIRNYSGAKVMTLAVAEPASLRGIARGVFVEFHLVVSGTKISAENLRVLHYASAEREPATSTRLQSLDAALGAPNAAALSAGDAVPDFTLTDQKKRPVRFADFAGKVVALNFVYTRCVQPEYCLRIANNFGALQTRYKEQLGNNLILLTVTFDPVHDQPENLGEYARMWNPNPDYWHFLTGPVPAVQRVCDLFGVSSVPDEGLFVHSLHTAVIGRDGKLVANLEGNQFTPQQLGDLVGVVLASSH